MMKKMMRSAFGRLIWVGAVLVLFGSIGEATAIEGDPEWAMHDGLNVALLADPSYVDTDLGTDGEVNNLKMAMELYGCTVNTFVGVDSASISNALSAADVFLVPELEKGDLASILDSTGSSIISNFVASGHSLIICGERYSNDENFLNRVFGFSINGIDSSGSSTLTSNAVGTVFEGGPATLDANNGSYEWMTASLPDRGLELYGFSAYTTVAQIPVGSGTIIFLAYDWWNGFPHGAQDGGWHEALGRALSISSDDLAINPAGALRASIYEGGSYAPTNQIYTLTNTGITNLAWSASNTAPWIVVSPTNGVLAAGDSVAVTVAIDSMVESFPVGTSTDVVVFNNITSGNQQTRDVQFDVRQRVLDHFEWEAIGMAQIAGHSFPVTVTAKDVTGETLPNYAGTTQLTGLGVGAEVVGSILNNPTNSNSIQDPGSYTVGHAFTPSSPLTVTHVRHYFGSKVSIWTDTGTLLASQNVVSVPGTWVETALPTPITLSADVRYRIGVAIENGTLYFRDDMLSTFMHGTIDQTYIGIDDGFPTIGDGEWQWWFVDLTYTMSTRSAVAILPASSEAFTAGVWTGSVTVLEAATNMVLRADAGGGYIGDSNPFNVEPLILTVHLPQATSEGDGMITGEVRANVAPDADLDVTLVSDDTTEATVVAGIVMPAGQTNTTFNLQVVDDGILDGTQTASITALATNYAAVSAAIQVHDNEVAALALIVPQTTYEGAGTVAGMVTVNSAPAEDVTVALISDNPAKISSGSVVIPAGQNMAPFTLAVIDDDLLDGVQMATIVAQVQNWVSGQSPVFIFDNENTGINLQVSASAMEGDGVLTNAGTVSLSGTTAMDVHIALSASDTTEISVPALVTIPAGQSQTMFNITVVDDAETDGQQLISVLAESSGYVPASQPITVQDNDVHHFVVSGLSTNYAVLEPVQVGIVAQTIDGLNASSFSGSVSLSANGDHGNVSVTPVSVTNFAAGAWTGDTTFGSAANNVTLTANDGAGHSGTSAVFNVLGSQIALTPDSLTNTLVVAGETLTRTMVISNAGNVALEFEIQGSVEGGADQDPGLVAYFPFSGSADDESGNGHDGTVNGATLTTDRHGNANSAYNFDGVSNYISVSDNEDFTVTDVTIAAWVKTSDKSDYKHITSCYGTGYDSDWYNLYLTSGSGLARWAVDIGGGGTVPVSVGTSDLADDQWHFVVGVRDTATSVLKVYVDGVLESTSSDASTEALNPEVDFWIGGQNGLSDHFFNGAIDDVSIYNRALSEEEITELYDPGDSNEPDSSLVAYFPFNGNSTDESGNGHDGTVIGAVLATDRFGNPDSAYLFDGSNDRIALANESGFDIERTNTFSQSFWIKTGNTGTHKVIFGKMIEGGTYAGYSTSIMDTGELRFYLVNSWPSNHIRIETVQALDDDQWHHVAYSYDGSSLAAGVKIYIDGLLANVNVIANSLSGSILNNIVPTIGSRDNNYYFSGMLDDVSFYNRTLSASEITDLYSEGGDVGLVAHYPFNGNASDESGNGHNGTVIGATLTTDRHGNAESAYLFDGVNNHISVSDHPDFTVTDVTIAAWVKTSDKSDYKHITSCYGTGYNSDWYNLYLTSGSGLTRWAVDIGGGGTVPVSVGTSDLADDQWHFVVGVRDTATSELKVYVDGVLESTASDASTEALNPEVDFWIGGQNGWSDRFFTGAIDDVSIYSRALSQEEITELYDAGDSENPDPSLVAYLPFSGNADDESGNGYDGAVIGATPTIDRHGNANSAYSFDGVNDYIDLGTMGGFQSVSMWVRQRVRSNFDYYLGHNYFRFYASTAENGRLTLGDGSAHVVTPIHMDNYVGQWIHIVAVKDGVDSKVYLNGTNVTVSSGTLLPVSTAVVNLGRWPGGTHYLNGDLDDVRIYDRVLSESDISDLYNESNGDDGGGVSDLVAYFPFNGNATDESGNGHDGTVNGAILTADRHGNANSAYLFDGSGDYIEVQDAPELRLNGTSFTISTWLKEVSRNPTYQGALLTKRGSGTANGWFYSNTGNQASMGTGKAYYQISGGYDPYGYTDAMIPLDTWTHSVITYDVASQTLRFYINGVLDSEHANIPSPNPATAVNMFIGIDSAAQGYAFHGALDDIRIHSRALSVAEITALYNEAAEAGSGDSWLTTTPKTGTVPPGSNMTVSVEFDAAGMVAADYTNLNLIVTCNDLLAPSNTVPVSMWVLPPAPVMADEPEFTQGTTNSVAWRLADGPVEYLTEALTDTNNTPVQQSGWMAGTNYIYTGLSTNVVYYYHTRASVITAIGRLDGPWSEWVQSQQVGDLSDVDSDLIPDWWEAKYFGGASFCNALIDSDGDGQINRDEFIAGMDPTNSASVFMVRAVETSSSEPFVIRWDSVTGRVYSVYWKTNMPSSFQSLGTGIRYPQNSYTDSVHNAESQGFYRIGVELE